MINAKFSSQVLAVAGLVIGCFGSASAANPAMKCLAAKAKAAGRYLKCEQQAQATLNTTAGVGFDFDKAVSKCRVKYTDKWADLQSDPSLVPSSCDTSHLRFKDNLDGTVTDNLTELQWEQKTGSGIQDVAATYTWNNGTGPYTAANGPVFTTFLSSLNSGCFAGQCDWRLPTREELQTILNHPFPCTTSPCIDSIFGPTQAGWYWSSTTLRGTPSLAWLVYFGNGSVYHYPKPEPTAPIKYVRAVRGNLGE